MAPALRTCIVCRQIGDKAGLLRLARSANPAGANIASAGFVVGSAAMGRGAYVHAACVAGLESKHVIAASTSSRRSASRATVAKELAGGALANLRASLASSVNHLSLSSSHRGGTAAV